MLLVRGTLCCCCVVGEVVSHLLLPLVGCVLCGLMEGGGRDGPVVTCHHRLAILNVQAPGIGGPSLRNRTCHKNVGPPVTAECLSLTARKQAESNKAQGKQQNACYIGNLVLTAVEAIGKTCRPETPVNEPPTSNP